MPYYQNHNNSYYTNGITNGRIGYYTQAQYDARYNAGYNQGVNDSKRNYKLVLELGGYGGSWVGGRALLYDTDTNTILAIAGCEGPLTDQNNYTFALQPSSREVISTAKIGQW